MNLDNTYIIYNELNLEQVEKLDYTYIKKLDEHSDGKYLILNTVAGRRVSYRSNIVPENRQIVYDPVSNEFKFNKLILHADSLEPGMNFDPIPLDKTNLVWVESLQKHKHMDVSEFTENELYICNGLHFIGNSLISKHKYGRLLEGKM